MAALSSTKVDLSGLLEVLGKNLYSTPTVAVRELIQNSHDACIRNSIESPFCEDQYRIDIQTKPGSRKLIIRDNGSGLTFNEIEEFLATIGSGYTRLLRNKSETEDMIGYFGLGFLSAYVVADKVEVKTTSYQTPDQTWLFTSKGGQRFSIQGTKQSQRGSEIILHLKTEFEYLADVYSLSKLLTKYCCLLPIPLHLNGNINPINCSRPPWKLSGSPLTIRKEYLNFANLFEHQFEPICVIPILENDLNVEGCLWIQDGGGYATSDFRNVNIFVRNMFITGNDIDLLPRWAGFCGCVINTPTLTPTASREDIQANDAYMQVQSLLAESLIQGLNNLSNNEPESWRRVLRRHNESLLGAAISDDRLFENIKDQLKIPTSLGKMTLSAISQSTDMHLFIQPEEKQSYQSILFKAQMKPIISGHYHAVSAYCQKYAEKNPKVNIVLIGHRKDENALFPKIEINSEQREILAKLFSRRNEEIIFSSFEPEYIPLLIIENEEAKIKNRIESDQADKRIGSAILALARKTTNQYEGGIHRRIYINMKCDLIANITSHKPSTQKTLSNLIRSYISTLSQDSEDIDFTEEMKSFFNNLNQIVGIS